MGSGWQELLVDQSPMPVWVGIPEIPGPHPAVIVAQHAGGIDGFIRNFVDRLAANGYVAVAPALFHRDPGSDQGVIDKMPRDPSRLEYILSMASSLKDEEILRDIQAVIDNLERLSGGAVNSIGITGFCLGGRVTFLVAGSYPESISAAAPFYPSGVFKTTYGRTTSPFDLIANIECPIAGFLGADDDNPSPEQVRQIEMELTRHGKQYEFTSYPDAAHLFMDFQTPGAYREKVAADAWNKALAFFDKNLKLN